MDDPDPHARGVDRFVAAVHRRMVVLRAFERLGLCAVGGCGVALLLMPILLSRGEPTGGLVVATLSASCFAGLVWAVLSRPSRLAAAGEADRQLGLADLLATALTLPRGRALDEVERTVLALADARCRTAAPSAVVLNRFGSRGWGGIGLALALVVGVNMMGPDLARSEQRAAAEGPRSWTAAEFSRADDPPRVARTPFAPDLRRAKPGTGGDDPDPLASAVPEPSSPAAAIKNAAEPTRDGAGRGTDGAGRGAGQSPPKTDASNPSLSAGSAATETLAVGESASGGGSSAATDEGSPGANSSSTAGGVQAGRRPAPVWRSEGWPSDRRAAEAAVRNGRVPDAYRDLVRGYFNAD